VEAAVLDSAYAGTKKRPYSPLGKATLTEIATWLSRDISRFGISRYAPSPALVYWFVDGIDRGRIALGAREWRSLCDWARSQFNRQRSLVVAQHEALMDPIAMAMAACLCVRLRKIAQAAKSSGITACLQLLPSVVELQHSIKVFFDRQGPSGIWPKYFPLFHYPRAGSNFCFTYETLEAVLAEFGNDASDLLATPPILQKLERALTWCTDSRLTYSVKGRSYTGWNSGGEIQSLNEGKPESWATAVVHMFLCELQHVLATKAQAALLRKYNAPSTPSDSSLWNGTLDMNVHLQGSTSPTTVKEVLDREILHSASSYKPFSGGKIEGRLSVLLFGPPGTSKTQIARALAAKLGWPLLLIDPSQFLSKGLENIYSRATEIFRDLQDLSAVVVLFDEMDALVRTRDGGRVDLTSQFLTTSMLPKLASLHDQASLVFLFATNYQADFDLAIKRPGRFDVLLCVGPPPLEQKRLRIDRFFPTDTPPGEIARAKKKFTALCSGLNPTEVRLLDLLTFHETEGFFDSLSSYGKSRVESICSVSPSNFTKQLQRYSRYVTLRPGEALYKQYEEDQKESRLQ
jgi:ATPases of the AAA+ class